MNLNKIMDGFELDAVTIEQIHDLQSKQQEILTLLYGLQLDVSTNFALINEYLDVSAQIF